MFDGSNVLFEDLKVKIFWSLIATILFYTLLGIPIIHTQSYRDDTFIYARGYDKETIYQGKKKAIPKLKDNRWIILAL